MQTQRHKRNWEDLADIDALWAVCTDPNARHGKWNVEEFFRGGERDIGQVLADARALGCPQEFGSVLDFGCGVGRLTRALSHSFRDCYGVDISAGMVARARELNQAYSNCQFLSNDRTDLSLFENDRFDMVLSLIVLQHIPSREVIKAYIAEFVRVLRQGGLLVFQLPYYIEPKDMRQARSKLYAVLRTIGFDKKLLYERLGLHPIRMNFIPEHEVLAHLAAQGARVLRTEDDTSTLPSLSKTYFVTK